jgi:hypothetical protein
VGGTIDVSIPLAPEADLALQDPARREAAGRYLSAVLREGTAHQILAAEIALIKREAHANGLTDADVDAELEAWRAERAG